MRVFASVFLSCLLACSSGVTGSESTNTAPRVALDANAFCDKYITTCSKSSTTLADCVSAFTAVRVTPECADAIEMASCDDFSDASTSAVGNTSRADDICFPSCSTPGSQTCNGDGTITACGKSSTTIVLDCNASCSTVSGQTWSGICGKTAEGQTSDKDKCWCK